MTGFTNHPHDVKIGARGKPNDSAVLDIESTTKGFLKPRMTTAERLALTPVEGLEVFDTDLGLPFVYGNGTWGSFAGIPAAGSSTDNAIVRWDGTSGSILQDSVVTISDTGDMSALNSIQAGNILISGNDIESTDVDGDITINPNGTGRVVIAKDLQVLGTTTTVESTTLEVVDANITINKNGNQSTADINDAGLTVEMSDATDALLHYDSTATSKWKVGELGSTKEIVTISDVQDLTNKRLSNGATINANLDLQIESTTKSSKPWPTMTEAQRDALTPVDGAVIKNSDTDSIEIYSTAEGAWVPVGAGGGLDQWITATDYEVGDVVWLASSNTIYRCIANHTASADFLTDLANWKNLSNLELSTGILSGCTMSINGGDASTLDISAGEIIIANRATGRVDVITFAGVTGATVTDIATQGQSYVSIDNTGTVLFESTMPTETKRRTQVYLGKIIHEGNTVIEVVSNQKEIAYGASNSLADFIRAFNLVNLGGNTFGGSGSLDLNYDGGKIYATGSNHENDPNNPNTKTFASANPLSFRYRYQDGVQSAFTNAIDPTRYESSAGVLSVIPGSANRATVQRVYLFPSGVIRIMYGQAFYNNISKAIQSIPTASHVIEANIADNAILVCAIAIRAGATDLSVPTDARFLYPNAFGQLTIGASGFSVSSLQNAYNNSEDPEIDLNTSGVTIRDNATPITGNMLEALDNADNEVFGVSVTETKVKQLGFVDNATAKVNTTALNNITYTDAESTKLLKKENYELYFQDWKDTLPTDLFSSVSASLTVNDSVGTEVQGRMATITQSSASTNDSAEIVIALPTLKADWHLTPIKIQELLEVNGGSGTFAVSIQSSTDGIAFTDAGSIPELNAGLDPYKSILQLTSDVTHLKIKYSVITPDDATSLIIHRVHIASDAFPVGQITKMSYVSGAGNGGGATTSLVTNIDFTEISDSLNSFDGTTFTAPFSASYNIEGGIKHDTAVGGVSVYAYINGVQDIELGYAVPVSAIHRFSGTVYLEEGQQLTIRDNNGSALLNDVSRHVLSIEATAYADNVIVDGKIDGVVGSYVVQAESTEVPQGSLLADGSAVSRTVYADLFSVIGTTYGVGDGSTTFNLPDKSSETVGTYFIRYASPTFYASVPTVEARTDGVEYRTNERVDGQWVYAVTHEGSSISDDTLLASGVTKIIEAGGSFGWDATYDRALPFNNGTSTLQFDLDRSLGTVRTDQSQVWANGYFITIKYLK